MEAVDVLFERAEGETWEPVKRLAGLTGTVRELSGKGLERARPYLAGVTHLIQVPFVRGGVPEGLRATIDGQVFSVGASVQVGESVDCFVTVAGG